MNRSRATRDLSQPGRTCPRRRSVRSPKGGTVVQLSGAVVLVTGASGGISRATAQPATRRGATVVCADRDAVALQETAARCGGAALIADLRRHDALGALMEEVLGSYGRLDAVVADAGLLARHAVAAFRTQAAAGNRRTGGLVLATSVAALVEVTARASTRRARGLSRASPSCCARNCGTSGAHRRAGVDGRAGR